MSEATSVQKSNRGREPIKNIILTSPDNVKNLRRNPEKKRTKRQKKRSKEEGEIRQITEIQ